MTTPETILFVLFMLSSTFALIQYFNFLFLKSKYEKAENPTTKENIVIAVELNTDKAMKGLLELQVKADRAQILFLQQKIETLQVENEYFKKQYEVLVQQKNAGQI